MPGSEAAWLSLTASVTVAVYLHRFGIIAFSQNAATEPDPPAIIDYALLDENTIIDAGALSESDSSLASEMPPLTRMRVSSVYGHIPFYEEVETKHHVVLLAKAKALRDQSASLHQCGKDSEALNGIQESVRLFRVLMGQNPITFITNHDPSPQHFPSRSKSFETKKESLPAIMKHVNLYPGHAEEHSTLLDEDLVSSLDYLTNHLSESLLYRNEEILLLMQESIEIYRMILKNPETHTLSLAISLCDLSDDFLKYDLKYESLVAIHQAARIYQVLATEQPKMYRELFETSIRKLVALSTSIGLDYRFKVPAQDLDQMYIMSSHPLWRAGREVPTVKKKHVGYEGSSLRVAGKKPSKHILVYFLEDLYL